MLRLALKTRGITKLLVRCPHAHRGAIYRELEFSKVFSEGSKAYYQANGGKIVRLHLDLCTGIKLYVYMEHFIKNFCEFMRKCLGYMIFARFLMISNLFHFQFLEKRRAKEKLYTKAVGFIMI